MADDDGDSDEVLVHRPLQAAACTYRIAFVPSADQKVLTLRGAMPRKSDSNQTLCADNNGFSLHAAVSCAAASLQEVHKLLCLAARRSRSIRLQRSRRPPVPAPWPTPR